MLKNSEKMENDELLNSEERELKKNKLKSSIDEISASLTNQLDDKKELGRKVLIAAGIVVAGYSISQLLLSSSNDDDEIEEKNTKSKNNSEPFVINMLKGVATSVILSLAKTKLEKMISDFNSPQNDNSPEPESI